LLKARNRASSRLAKPLRQRKMAQRLHACISLPVLMDMPKNLDSINHNMLLSKSYSLGLSPSAQEWFNSYLKGRYQQVRIGDTVSQSLPLDYDVLQRDSSLLLFWSLVISVICYLYLITSSLAAKLLVMFMILKSILNIKLVSCMMQSPQ